MTEGDATRLRRAIALAQQARERGDGAFGALLLGKDGALLAEAGNTAHSDDDLTCHAEMNALRQAAAAHGSARLNGATLYASTEPCPMCAAAAYVTGIRRIVFGLAAANLAQARGGPPPWLPLALPAAEIAARGRRPMQVEGPFLEAEAAQPHAGLGA